MLIGGRTTKPVLVYIALGIIVVALAITLLWSGHQQTAPPAKAPMHEDQ